MVQIPNYWPLFWNIYDHLSNPDQGGEATGLHNAPLHTSSRVHTSVWLSNLPSPSHSANTDTPPERPDRPGSQRMKGESGRKKEYERKELQQNSRTQTPSRFFFLFWNNNQPRGGAEGQEHPHGQTLLIYSVFLEVIPPLCSLKNAELHV